MIGNIWMKISVTYSTCNVACSKTFSSIATLLYNICAFLTITLKQFTSMQNLKFYKTDIIDN
jgi:hypothetical protein